MPTANLTEKIFARLTHTRFAEHFFGDRVMLDERFFNETSFWDPNMVMGWLKRQCDFSMTTVLVRSADPPRRAKARYYKDVEDGLAAGRSIQILQMQKHLGPQDDLTLALMEFERFTALPIESVSVFLTPGEQQALPIHTDEVRVVTLQLHGTKNWDLWEDYSEGSVAEHCGSNAPRRVILREGSMLYVPPKVPHRVTADSQTSVSAGFIFREITMNDLLRKLTERPEFAVQLARSLPILSGALANDHLWQIWKRFTGDLANLSANEINAALRELLDSSSKS